MINIDSYRKRLLFRKSELATRLEKLEDVLDDPKSLSFSEHAIESEFDEAYEAQGREGLKELKAIDAALERIDNKTFSICQTCGETISTARLCLAPNVSATF